MKLQINNSPVTGLWILIVLLIVTFLPSLGDAIFNSKGEPREAVVAVSMLQSGDWILPVSNGGDIPYKPPFLAWCIALCSLVIGHVTEFTSRLPSALALIAMVVWGYRFYSRRGDWLKALISALVTITAFEVYRAGYACRVDMVLTFFIVTALYHMFAVWQRGWRFPLLAVVLMSGAVLTKGPVGVLLPCLVMGVFMLLKGENFWKSLGRLSLVAIASLIIPAMWYVAAYAQGGQEFVDLALEENIGRATGTMSYASHANPWYYNLITVVSGYAPYTLLALLAVPLLKRAKMTFNVKGWWTGVRQMDDVKLFSLVSIVVIFVFYCIPESKRSVYLLPIYPFIACFVTEMIVWLARNHRRVVDIYGGVLSVVAILASLAFIAVQCELFPYEILKGKRALENAMMVTALEQRMSITEWLVVELSAIAGGLYLMKSRRLSGMLSVLSALLLTLSIYWAFSAVYQPAVLGAKSDKPIALELNRLQPEGDIYSYVKTPMLRFYIANFYTGDRIKQFEKELPDKGLLIVGVEDAREFLPKYKQSYDWSLVKHWQKRGRDVGQQVLLLRFNRKE